MVFGDQILFIHLFFFYFSSNNQLRLIFKDFVPENTINFDWAKVLLKIQLLTSLSESTEIRKLFSQTRRFLGFSLNNKSLCHFNNCGRHQC